MNFGGLAGKEFWAWGVREKSFSVRLSALLRWSRTEPATRQLRLSDSWGQWHPSGCKALIMTLDLPPSQEHRSVSKASQPGMSGDTFSIERQKNVLKKFAAGGSLADAKSLE